MSGARTTNAEILKKIETVDSRVAKLQSDVNDLSINGARDNERINQMYVKIDEILKEFADLKKLFYGNGEGMKSQVEANTTMRKNLNKLFWIVVAETAGMGFLLAEKLIK